MIDDFIAYKAIDERQRETLINAWISAAPTLYEHAGHTTSCKRFTSLMLEVITLSENYQILRTFSPGVYEVLIIPSKTRATICEVWEQLYQSLPVKVAEMEDVQQLASLINVVRVAPQNISGMEG